MMNKEKYEKMTKAVLMEMCTKRKIPYKTKFKKAEIIDLLIKNDKKKPKSSKVQAKANPKIAKPKSAEVPAKVANPKSAKVHAKVAKSSKTCPPKTKKPVKTNTKQSVIMVIPLIQNLISDVEKSLLDADKRSAVDTAEQLKIIMEEYNFHGMKKLKDEITRAISLVVETFSSERQVPKRATNYDITDVDVRFKTCLKTKSRKKLTITLEELETEIENPDFITNFTRSIKDLMRNKVIKYTKIRERIGRENEITAAKVKKLKASGTTDRVIEDMYPCFSMMKAFKLDLEDLIELIKRRSTITETIVKSNLLEALNDSEHGLCCITGRDNIKNDIAAQIYSFSKGYKTFVNSFNNIAIYGPSGSGKTYIAQIISFVFSKIGVLAKNNIKIVTKADLTGQYVGHTAPRTRASLIETLEGILFIDEAYQLTDVSIGSKDYGGEAIAEMINFMDKYIGLSIVIVAGYEDKMRQTFMTFNEGLPRRFPYIYTLESYTDKELTDILINNLIQKLPDCVDIDEETSNYIYSLISTLRTEMPLALRNQAGDMLNLSSALNKTIISSYQLEWENEDIENNKQIILAGLEDFLDHKNIEIET
jgi:ATPase family associated with various cellular activities (AAA)